MSETAQEFYARTKTWPTFKVPRGASLSLITWWFDRSPAEILMLYGSNSDLIGPDVHRLEVGWDLRVPPGWSATPTRPTTSRPTATWARTAAAELEAADKTAAPEPRPEPKPIAPVPAPAAPARAPVQTVTFTDPAVARRRKSAVAAGGALAAAGVGFGLWFALRSPTPTRTVAGARFGGLARWAGW